jgi:prepilin-type N-terminal cleavage/methylation domain-containing protein
VNSIKQVKEKSHGFTIVELLVVIVVIGILAAITIVSYGSVTTRAYTATAQSTADAVARKAKIFFTESASNWYPTTYAALSTPTTATWYLPPSTAVLDINGIGSAPATTAANTISLQICGGILATPAVAPTTAAQITAPFGIKTSYWHFTNAAEVVENIGDVATGVGAVTRGGVAYTTACFYAQT